MVALMFMVPLFWNFEKSISFQPVPFHLGAPAIVAAAVENLPRVQIVPQSSFLTF